MKLKMRVKILAIAAVLTALAPAARAAERITLRNGFAITCDHHAVVESHMRLYLSAGEDNYIEFPSAEIVQLEQVPDPPAPPPETRENATEAAKTGSSNSGTGSASPDAKLSQVDLGEILARAGKEHNLDVDLLASVVKAESAGDPHAVSRAGARGLMQLMPGTATDLGVNDSYKPDENVRGGSTYLDLLLVHYRDNLALALAAYNAGPAAVDKYHGIPPFHETRAYVARVIHEFNRRVLAREAQARHAVAAATTP